MAKNKAQVNVNHYANQEEAIRKAKGNPNKNIHHKKNNSNYGGGDYQREKTAQAAKKPERVKLPLWLKITLGVLFGVLLAFLFVCKQFHLSRWTLFIFFLLATVSAVSRCIRSPRAR